MDIPKKKFVGDVELPVYGLGTWQMGGRLEADVTKDQKEITAIELAIQEGITHIDTAELYGNGHTEEIIAKAISATDRSKLFIASKVSAWNQTYEGVYTSFSASLDRLGVDYLDLYMLHRYPEPGISISDTMKAINELMVAGKIKHFGVCNMTVPMLQEVQKHTSHPIVCNQVHYSLVCREIVDKGILEYCQQNDIAVAAWGPLEKGALESSNILSTLAKKYGKTPYQIALNWLISQDGVVTISKTSQVQHLNENLGALGWRLEDSDRQELTDNFPGQSVLSDRVPLNYETDLGA